MGQKSNLNTLRHTKNYLHLSRLNNIEFLYGFYFTKFLKFLFNIRKIFVTSLTLNFVENKIYINLDLFFRASKLLALKKKKFHIFKKTNSATPALPVFTSLHFLKKRKIIFNCNIINIRLRKKILLFQLFKANKRYAFTMFPRRFNFFLDFLKLSILFKENYVSASFFITVLAEIFQILQKKKHAKFLYFLNKYFHSLITLKSYNDSPLILGIKFLIRGKLKGKRRKSNLILNCGHMPIQNLSQPIEFSKTHAYTVYGVFGLKLWVYRSKIKK